MPSEKGASSTRSDIPSQAESQASQALVQQAWQLLEQRKFDEANKLCISLLAAHRLNEHQRAGIHLILAHTSSTSLPHAREALTLFERVQHRLGLLAPQKHVARLQKDITFARYVLQKAHNHEMVYCDGRLFEQMVQDMELWSQEQEKRQQETPHRDDILVVVTGKSQSTGSCDGRIDESAVMKGEDLIFPQRSERPSSPMFRRLDW